MDVLTRNVLRASLAAACGMLPCPELFAITYNYPTAGGGTLAVAPQTLATGDTLNVNSGTFATTNSTNYTVSFPLTPAATGQTVNVAAGATLGYQGTDPAGAAIKGTRNDNTASTETITNNGIIDGGTGLFGILISNSFTGNTNDHIIINNEGSVLGGIMVNGQFEITLNVNNTASVGPSNIVQGAISLTTSNDAAASSTMNVGNSAATNYTTGGTLQDITNLIIFANSTLTTAYEASTIKTVTNNGTININETFGGLSSSDGTFTNNGTANISANVTKTGSFITASSAQTNIREAVTFNTATYNAQAGSIHASVLTDILNYGNLTLSGASSVSIATFASTYEGGYLPGQTYTLLTSPVAITGPTAFTKPADTLFLTFSLPTEVGNTIQQVITRTPFQTFAQSNMTQNVGTALEYLGAQPNPAQSLVTVLNAVEASTTATQVEAALRQLAPLIAAPLYGIEVQAEMMEQVELRLASLRNEKIYMAGDLSIQNAIWIRPFGDKANQQEIGDSLGYYASTGGVAIGFDRYVDHDMILGMAGAYALSHVRDKINTASVTDVKSYQAMLYGSLDLSNTKYLNLTFAAAANNYNAIRYININTLQLAASGDYSSQVYGTKAVWGKNFSAFDFLQVNPEASLQYTFAKQYEYAETGAPGANLQVTRTNSNVVQGGLGGKLSTPIEWHPGIFVPEVHAMYYYNLVNGAQITTANFLAGGGEILANIPLQRNWLRFGVSATFAILDWLQVKINYDHYIADRFTDNAFYINFKYSL